MSLITNKIESSPFSSDDKVNNLKEMFEKQLRSNKDTYGLFKSASDTFLKDKIESDIHSKQNSNREKVYEKALG